MRPVKILVYGHYGSGKTTFVGGVADVPELSPAILLVAEDGTESIESKIGNGITLSPRIRTYANAVAYVNQAVLSKDYKTVIFDSATAMLQILLEEACDRNDHQAPTWQEWNEANFQMQRLFRALSASDKNIIVTSLARSFNPKSRAGANSNAPHTHCGLDVNPTSSRRLLEFTSYAWSIHRKDENSNTRVLLTQPKKLRDGLTWEAKTRSEVAIPPIIENPSIPELFNTYIKKAESNT